VSFFLSFSPSFHLSSLCAPDSISHYSNSLSDSAPGGVGLRRKKPLLSHHHHHHHHQPLSILAAAANSSEELPRCTQKRPNRLSRDTHSRPDSGQPWPGLVLVWSWSGLGLVWSQTLSTQPSLPRGLSAACCLLAEQSVAIVSVQRTRAGDRADNRPLALDPSSDYITFTFTFRHFYPKEARKEYIC